MIEPTIARTPNSLSRRKPELFIVARGQYYNIGDIILRRPLLEWARACGTLHVYVGRSPGGYVEGLGLGEKDVVYQSFSRWYAALLWSALRGFASSIYKPGEIQLSVMGLREHIAMIPAVALVRLRGGTVSRVGVGARSFSPIPRLLMWPSNALSSFTRWRDHRTAAFFGFGPPAPDLAFGPGLDDQEILGSCEEDSRKIMVISMREDIEVAPRPFPNSEWISGVKSFANSSGLKLWVATQVSVDDDRSRRLAKLLDAQLLEWPVASGHADHEHELRTLYRRAHVVASDRLHVIIAGMTEGATPVGLQLNDSDKITRHFETIGIEDVAFNAAGMSASQIQAALERIAYRRPQMLRKLVEARSRLRELQSDFQALLTGG